MVQLPLGRQARSLRSGPVAWRVPGASGVAMPALSAASPALRTVGETGRNSLAAVPTLRVVPSARTVELSPGSRRLARPRAVLPGRPRGAVSRGGVASCGRGHRPACAWLATPGPPARRPCRRAADVAGPGGWPDALRTCTHAPPAVRSALWAGADQDRSTPAWLPRQWNARSRAGLPGRERGAVSRGGAASCGRADRPTPAWLAPPGGACPCAAPPGAAQAAGPGRPPGTLRSRTLAPPAPRPPSGQATGAVIPLIAAPPLQAVPSRQNRCRQGVRRLLGRAGAAAVDQDEVDWG